MSSASSAWDFTIDSGQYRVRVVPEEYEKYGGYRAKLISIGIGTIMEPHGRTQSEALMTLVRELNESAFERKLAKEITRHAALPLGQGAGHATKKIAHASKRAVPGVSKWSTTAGGTGAAEGKHGYTLTLPEGTYHIWPYTTKVGRHAGYNLKFSATGGRPRGSHGGLWHDLGSHASPQKAASAAAKHYGQGFD